MRRAGGEGGTQDTSMCRSRSRRRLLASLGSKPALWEALGGSRARPCHYNKPYRGIPGAEIIHAEITRHQYFYSVLHAEVCPRALYSAGHWGQGSCWRRDAFPKDLCNLTTRFLLPTAFSAAIGSVYPARSCSFQLDVPRALLPLALPWPCLLCPCQRCQLWFGPCLGLSLLYPPAVEAPGGNSSSSSFLATSRGVFALKAGQLRMPVLLQQQQVSLSSSMS